MIDEQTILISSQETISQSLYLEFYPIGDMASDTAQGQSKVEQLQAVLNRNQMLGSGKLQFDPISKCVLALLTKPAHAELTQQLVLSRSN